MSKDVTTSDEVTGVVTRVDPRGFCFVRAPGVPDLFIHTREFPNGLMPATGARVRCLLGTDRDGRRCGKSAGVVDG